MRRRRLQSLNFSGRFKLTPNGPDLGEYEGMFPPILQQILRETLIKQCRGLSVPIYSGRYEGACPLVPLIFSLVEQNEHRREP